MSNKKSNLIKISKNCYKGPQITAVSEVLWCARNNMAIYHLTHNRIYPAKVICNWQLSMVSNHICLGFLYRVLKDE